MEAKIYDYVSNSCIVQIPGRAFPAVVLQGDSVSTMLLTAIYFMRKATENEDEDMYYEALEMAERLQGHLVQYEKVLEKEGFDKPYSLDINGLVFEKECQDT